MSKMKIFLAIAFVAILIGSGITVWKLLPGPGAPPDNQVTAVAPVGEQRPPATCVAKEPAASDDDQAALPPPVDLDAANRDLDLFGVVVDRADRPVAGAKVETMSYPWRRVVMDVEHAWERDLGPETLTASDGTFSLRLDRGQAVDLRVTATDFAATIVPQCLAGERVKVVIPEGSDLEVVTKDEDGRPAPGVRLEFWRMDASKSIPYDHREGVTDEAGRYLFTAMHPGAGTVSLEHDALGMPGWQMITIPSRGTERLEVSMPTGRTVQGRVTDAVTGEPIASARVGAGWTLERVVLTDEDGSYAFTGWTGRGYRELHVAATGYGRRGKNVPPKGDVNFELHPGDRVRGQVQSIHGDPLGGVLVGVMGMDHRGGKSKIDVGSTVTGKNGLFILTGLRTDLPHTLVLQTAGYGRVLLDFDHGQADGGLVEIGVIEMPEARTIEGRAVDERGNPHAGTVVQLTGHNDDRGRLRPGQSLFETHPYLREETRRTDDLGRFRFPGLSPGQYAVKLRDQSLPEVEASVILPPDRDLLDLELCTGEYGSIAFQVQNRDGAPVADVSVTAQWGPRWVRHARTGEDGKALLSGITASEVKIDVSPPRKYLHPPRKTVALDGQLVTIILEEACWVEGTVVAPDGESLANMLVRARRPSDGEYVRRVFTDEAGAFAIPCGRGENLDLQIPGTRRRVTEPGVRSEATPLRGEVPGVVAPATGIVIHAREITYDRTLIVRVLDPEGSPVASAQVWAGGVGISITQTSRETGPDGRATLEGLPPDLLTIGGWVSPHSPLPENWLSPDPVNMVPDGQEITLLLRQGIMLAGVVWDPEGQAVPGIGVTAHHEDRSLGTRADTDAEGRFRIAVPPGLVYRLVARPRRSDTRGFDQGEAKGITEKTGEIIIRLSR